VTPPEIALLLAEGVERHRAGDIAAAGACYLRVLAAAPREADALHLLGVLTCQRGQPASALSFLRQAAQLAPKAAAVHASLGHALLATGAVDAAIESFERALARDPAHHEARRQLGNALARAGRLDAAEATLRQALAARPHHAATIADLGTVLHRGGAAVEAADCFRAAIAADPRLAKARHGLIGLMTSIGESGAATEACREWLAYDPANGLARRLLAAIHHDRGGFAEAITLLRDSRATDDLLVLALALVGAGETDAAQAALERAVAADPGRFRGDGRVGIGARSPQQRSHGLRSPEPPPGAVLDSDLAPFAGLISMIGETTMQTAGRALSMDPTSESDLLDWARAYGRVGDLGRAAEIYRVMLDVDPDNPLAAHMLAAATGENALPRASDAYVQGLFDDFAKHFDENLAALKYQAPQLAADVLASFAAADGSRDILDLGCGTGLCGTLLRAYARRLVGVDLSAGMIALARDRAVYDELIVAEITAFLAEREASFDVVVSTDVLIYFGRLEGPLGGIARVLRPAARLVFTAERLGEGEIRLNPHGRYSHGEAYVRACVAGAGMTVCSLARAILRTESGHPVEGLLVCAEKR
jgi:predicted TPR repeat methyltransferase